MNTKAYCFAGCKIKLLSDTPVYDSKLFDDFRIDDFSETECDIEISILHSALPPKKGDLVFSDSISSYYIQDGKGYYYTAYPTFGGQTELSCRVTENDKITLYVTPGCELWDSLVAFAVNYTQLLFWLGTATMHSSCIEVDGKAVLFAGDKGAGKSTQAELWSRYRSAQIINGDRIALKVSQNGVTAYGIPFCGSSKIALNRVLDVKAIVLPCKSNTEFVQRLGTIDAFKRLIGNFTYNSEDPVQTNTAIDIVKHIAENVPVFCLMCRPDENSVKMLEEQLCKI